MGTELGFIHHVGHVVSNMEEALDLYRRLGFECTQPAYPMMAPAPGEPPKPFGAANCHATFARNFVEIVTVVRDGDEIPVDANLVPLVVPPEVLPRILEKINRTVATVSKCLARFEGTHILCFQSADVDASVVAFDEAGIQHSGANTVQRQVETVDGKRVVPVRYLEIDGEEVTEGRLAIAENPASEVQHAQSHMLHPNGAVDLVESLLCVADDEIDQFAARYQRYLTRQAKSDAKGGLVFELDAAHVRIIPASVIGTVLPGEAARALPGFVGYTIAVRDLESARALLERNGFALRETGDGSILVPSAAALGTAILFRQIG